MNSPGTRHSQVINYAGRIVPGGDRSIGDFLFKGAVTNHAAGRMSFELAGRGDREYDRLIVRNGSITARPTANGSLNLLGGTLEVATINGFKPVYRDEFKILDCNAINGTFDTVSLPGGNERWDASDLYTQGVIRFNVPPGTVIQIH